MEASWETCPATAVSAGFQRSSGQSRILNESHSWNGSKRNVRDEPGVLARQLDRVRRRPVQGIEEYIAVRGAGGDCFSVGGEGDCCDSPCVRNIDIGERFSIIDTEDAYDCSFLICG